MAVRIQLRRDTAANWVSADPVLRAGEIGIETDTLKFKIGTGATWTATPNYANVTPSGLSNSLNQYILAADQGAPGGPAELDSNGDLVIPENSIILWNDADYTYNTTVTATQPTADRTITLPDATTTLVGTDVAQTLTNKTLTSPVISGLSLSDASIVFEGTVADSYETTLTVGEPTADRTITLPDVTGTVVTTGDTGSVTNTMLAGSISNDKLAGSISNDKLAGSISNDKLANSSVTINGYSISLGGSATYGTDNINEGTSNLYFTNERAQDAVATALSNGTHTNITVSYDDNANAISLTGAVTYTDENAQDAVGNAVGNGLDYDDTTGAISVDPSEFALSAVGAPTSDVSMATYKITGLGTPTSDNDAANKAYVDAATSGLNVHASVKAATTGNININNELEAGDTLDGVVLANGDRVLVKNQNSPEHNGVYIVQNSGAATRATDYNTVGEVDAGDFIFVENGTANAKTGWIQTNKITTLDTDHIEFSQFSGAGTYSAGTGLTLTGSVFSINTGTTVDLNTAQTLTNKTITGTFSGNITGNVTGDVSGNAGTVTNGVYTTGSYADPAWITSLAKSKVGLGNVENTALSTWAGSTNITTLGTITTGTWTGTAIAIANGGTGATDAPTARTNLGLAIGTDVQAYNSTLAAVAGGTYTGDDSIATVGTITAGTWNGTAIGTVYGGTGLTSYATGDIVYASATNTLSKLSAGTDGYLLTLASGVPTWAAAPISLPAQSGSTVGKYLQSDGTSASWQTLVVPIETGTATLTANTATNISTTALSGFTSIEYMVSLKQGSKVRTSKVVLQTDGTSVDMTEFAITETGGTMTGVVVSATTSGTDAVLQATVTDAATTNVNVKFSKVKL